MNPAGQQHQRISASQRSLLLLVLKMPHLNHCVEQTVSKCVSISISLCLSISHSNQHQPNTPTTPHTPIHQYTKYTNQHTTPLQYTNQLHQLQPVLRTDTLKTLIKQHYDRINKLEDQKYDLEYVVKRKDVEVHEHHQLFMRHLKTPKSILDQNQKSRALLTLNNNNNNNYNNKNLLSAVSLSLYISLYLSIYIIIYLNLDCIIH